jgi:hypothetical protein
MISPSATDDEVASSRLARRLGFEVAELALFEPADQQLTPWRAARDGIGNCRQATRETLWREAPLIRLEFPPPPSLPAPAGRGDHAMTTPNTGIGALTTTTLRAITRAAEGCAVDGQPGRALMIALDVEPLVVEANSLLQGLAVLNRIARHEQDEAGG